MLHIHSSNQLEILIRNLVDILRDPLPDPFEKEVIVVYSQGMERWLALQLAKHLGVCSNLVFPFPAPYLIELMSRITPDWSAAKAAPYETKSLVWSLMEILPEVAKMPDATPLARYLDRELGEGDSRLHELAMQVARVFDRYLIYRPGLPRRWEQGRFLPSESWQARVWRSLVSRHGPYHRLALLEEFHAALIRGIFSAKLPSRISVFGVSSLAPLFLDALAALSKQMDVHLFFPNPCQEYWGDILSRKQRAKRRRGPLTESKQLEFELSSEPVFENELLAYFGSLGRDFLDLLLECEPSRPHEEYAEPLGQSLLSAIQRDILLLQEGSTGVQETEPSIRLFSCHGPMREIEVLHDTLLDLFERDPTLRPHEVVVMAPSIEKYSAKIQAIFSRSPDDERQIPFSVADRAGRATSSLGELFLRLLALAGSRWAASEICAIMESAPIMRRFGLTERAVEKIKIWVADTAIRWGRNGAAKSHFDLPPTHENTWGFGLDRMILGHALPLENRALHGGILPYDEIEGSDADTLAILLDIWEKLSSLANHLAVNKSPRDWADLCHHIARDFLPTELADQSERNSLAKVFEDFATSAQHAGFQSSVSVAVLRRFCEEALETRGGGAFLTGGVLFCDLLPMRCLPFRVVVLLGMSSQEFPRRELRLSFDLLSQNPSRGDRTRLSEDRYLFLEALLAARERFFLFHSGQSPRDNSDISPSVFVSQLQDYVARVYQIAPEKWLTRHRLQPFSAAYYSGAELFTYAREYEPWAGSPETISTLPPPEEEERIELDALLRFFDHPVASFFHERLGLREPSDMLELGDTEPLDLNKLDHWRLDQWMLDLIRAETSPDELADLLRASGWLPHGSRQAMEIAELRAKARAFADRLERFLVGPILPPLAIDVPLQEGRIVGQISDLREGGLRRFRFGKLRPRDKLRLWIEHLAIQSMPELPRNFSSAVLAEAPQPWVYDPCPPHVALRELQSLVDLRERGRAKPLLLFPRTSHAFAEARFRSTRGSSPWEAARKIWRGEGPLPGEGSEFHHRLVFDPERLPEDKEFERASETTFLTLLRQGHFDASF